ncbi:MAG: hypothetical protein COS82_05135 [Zetaproteobacteria bacterium CG06_land_8_20_14_3_00_59_53]|nr:MAG: hypothetical protein COX56_08260 [Zetaproteobacteria bacterium CG23_combo_of_CG06-09_8_20_14_all_59_86]PIQ65611.1 MAG: hypothetical protein COV97_02865 [Zetaproteobacteria bacterium CG11_big_fil_rev_8_21_14_0_20_59_439]PIU70627.1 MAG: hypothetical protein COS82_05135 [Zetaproteobacteria bacterium CG06_land_8_20_14_3_00_59_53]PIU98104.1 MAG: hypothetical protein COS62_00435 [Zetaproteobacteria bacterium CG03_land_8_20_14_0_80_59_51]PIY47940.1 MAG: hypothetical protein COZ02_00425 [Zetapr
MRVIRWMLGGVLVSALLAAGLWISAPWWLARLAQFELATMGFETRTIDIEEVGSGRCLISQLHIRRNDGSLEIEAGQAILSYTLHGLMRMQLDSLTLETLDVAVLPAPQANVDNSFSQIPPAAAFAAIPVDRIAINRITLRRLDAGHAIVQQLNGRVNYAEKSLLLSMGEADAQGLQAALFLSESGNCAGRISHAGMEVAQMNCQLMQLESGPVVRGSLQVDLGRLDSQLGIWLSMPEYKLSGSMQAGWKLDLAGGIRQLNFESTFNIDAHLDAIKLSLKGSVTYTGGKGGWVLADDSLARFGDDFRSRLSFAGLSGGFSVEDALSLSLNHGGILQLQDIKFDEMSIPRLDVRLLNAFSLTFSDALMLSQPADLSIHMSRLAWGANKLSIRGMQLHLKAGRLLAATGSLLVDGLMTDIDGLTLPIGRLLADVQFDGTSLTAQVGFAADDSILKLDGKLRHDSAHGSGQLNLSAAPMMFPAAIPFLNRFAGKNDDLLLQAGSLTVTGKLTWSKKAFAAFFLLHLADVKGAYAGNSFSGLSGDVSAVVDARRIRLHSENISAQMFDPGLPLADVGMRASVNYPFKGKFRFVLQDVHAQAFGGGVSSGSIDVDTARRSNPFVLRLEHVDVKQLVEFRKQEGLFADGLLDGTLPFDWTDKGLKMTAGSLDARMPGGLIRYLGTASMQQMAASDKAFGMAMQVLNNFHFKVLHTQADYQPDGQLTLHIALKGNNPGYEDGRPIELNLNIEENMLKLLQSLRAADEIGDRVEKSVKKKMQE